ncbi:TadE/TadG family type IV pilus assembly protein [Gluconacetobacter sp. Hr-1-5]|uniref:TadE/TadG family type IV pilus assembly protein n=1 Tax=Gluconacetobacter sp. Hr-1-5 TaxID=3395370 RepID=UPI003B51C04B
MSRGRDLARDGRAAAVIEFAIVAGIFLMMLVGAIEMGLQWWTRDCLQMTADLTARCVAVGACSDDPLGFATTEAAGWALPGAVSALSVDDSATSCHGMAVSGGRFVIVRIRSDLWSGLQFPFFASSLSVSACYLRVS